MLPSFHNVTRSQFAADGVPDVTPDVWRLDWWNCVYGKEDPHISEGFVHHLAQLPRYLPAWLGSGESGLVYSRAQDFWIIIITALITAALRILTKHFFFPIIANKCAGIPASNKKKTFKFCYQMWLLTYYTTTSAIGFLILRNMSWWGAPFSCVANAELWRDYPTRSFPRIFEIFYVGQAGFYVSEFVATCMESRRSDFWIYIWHHSCTLILILGSYMSLDVRIGSLVFLFHDVPDIFLSLTKVLHYMRNDIGTNVSFVGLALSYFFFRLYMFPGIIYTAWMLPLAWRPDQVWNAINLCFITFGLVPLHIFWFGLILKMGWKALFEDKGIAQDIRSDSEDEGDRAGKKSKPRSPKRVTQRKQAAGGKADDSKKR